MLVPIGTVISSGKRVMTSIRMARYGMLEANLALGNWINLEQLLEFPRISGVKFGIYWAVFGVLVIDAMPVGAADGTVAPALRVLRDECIGCHKPGKAKGGLLLTTREKMLLGGDEGAVVEPGKPDQSPLVTLLAMDGDPHMPPKKQLPTDKIEALRRWVTAGAAWDAAVFDELPTVSPVALKAPPAAYRPVLGMSISPDQKVLAVARGADVVLYDLTKPDHASLRVIGGEVEPVQSVAWSSDGSYLAIGGFRQARIWEMAAAKIKAVIAAKLVGQISAVVFTRDQKQLFLADGMPGVGGYIHRIDVPSGALVGTWKAHDDVIYGLRISAKGDWLASAAADKMARIWNVADGKLLGAYEGHTNHILGLAFDKEASRLATAGADREVKVWDVASHEQDVTLGDKKTAFTAVDWTPDGRVLVAVTERGTGSAYTDLKVHNGEQRSESATERKLAAVTEMLTCVALAADGKTVFAGGQSGRVYVWATDSGKQTGVIEP